MQVAHAERFGGPQELVPAEVADLVAGPGQAVIDVAVADVIFLETMLRGGWGQDRFQVSLPYVPGGGVAGVVVSASDDSWTGRRVVARLGVAGGYAEQALAPVERLIAVPDGVDLDVAAALTRDAVTALKLMDDAAIEAGDRVLVLPASGGLGALAVQLASAAGGRVIAGAGSQAKLDRLGGLGAEATVDYSDPDWPALVRELTGGEGLDVVLDGVGGDVGRAAFALTADGGQVSSHGMPSGEFATHDPDEAARRAISVRAIDVLQMGADAADALLARALELAAAGAIHPLIGQTFPLSRAADAHAAIESRESVGKTVLLREASR